MPQWGDVNAKEHDSTDIVAKRIKAHAFDGTSWVKLLCDASGRLITDNPLSGYKVSDEDGSSPAYYGYINSAGGWYIIKATTAGSVISYRYAAGASDYTTNWTGRTGLTYNYFNVEF